jgi:hypothetical protein
MDDLELLIRTSLASDFSMRAYESEAQFQLEFARILMAAIDGSDSAR